MGELCLAVDIGGTKMAAGLVGRSRHPAGRADRVPTAATGDPEELWAALGSVG